MPSHRQLVIGAGVHQAEEHELGDEHIRAPYPAWADHDIEGVLETLTDDCVVTESYGPVYRGRDRVEQWMRTWFEGGGDRTVLET